MCRIPLSAFTWWGERIVIKQTRQEMDQLIFGAGFGTARLSWLGYTAAKYYHWIVAGFTVAVILMAALPISSPEVLAVWLGAYLIYFAARQLMNRRARTLFYKPLVQFFRVQLAIIATCLLILHLGSKGQQTSLWLLFILALQMSSKHCPTWVFLVTVGEVWIALWALRLTTTGGLSFSPSNLYTHLEVLIQCWWIGILAFILHYLVRNIDARNETIAGYELVNTISSRLDPLTDSGEKWKAVLDTCLEVVGGHIGSLWICDHKRGEIKLLATSGASLPHQNCATTVNAPQQGAISLTNDDVMAYAARTARACYWVADENRVTCQESKELQLGCSIAFRDIHSLMVIPIADSSTSHPRALALLCVGFHKSSPPPRLVLSDYQTLLTNMIHHIRPLFYYERTLQELTALQTIGRQVSRGLELNEVLDSILGVIVNTLGFEFATISLVNEDQRLIRTVRGFNIPEEWIEIAVHHLDSEDIQADVVRTGKTEIIEGWDPRFDRRIWQRFGHQEMIRVFAPILIVDRGTRRERVIGTVEAGYRKANRNTIDNQQVTMLQAFINQASIAIEKAQLFQRMEKRAEALTSLHRVGQAIGAARQLPQVLGEIGRSAEQVLGADIVMLYRYDEEGHCVQTPVVFGTVWGKSPLSLSIKKEGILAKIIRDKTPYYAPDALDDPYLTERRENSAEGRRLRHRSFTQRQNIKSFAGVPLLSNGHIVGVMCVNYRKRHQFAEDEQQILELFGQQAAIAIKNAETNELARQLAINEERSRLSRELHDSISQYLPSINLMTYNAKALLEKRPQQALCWLEKVHKAADAVLKEMSFNVFRLKPVALKDGIDSAIATYARLINDCFELPVEVEIDLPTRLRPPLEEAVYMVIREATTNSARHSQAQRVHVKVACHNDLVCFQVRDDGCGFNPKLVASRQCHGLTNMRERINAVGGNLEIRTAPGEGTLVKGEAPSGRHTNERRATG
jgi:signal transduction histidine kinase